MDLYSIVSGLSILARAVVEKLTMMIKKNVRGQAVSLALLFMAGCFWRGTPAPVLQDEVFGASPSLLAVVDTVRAVTVKRATEAEPKVVPWPVTKNLRLELLYFLQDTIGETINPRLRVQAWFERDGQASDWFDLRCVSAGDECDYAVVSSTVGMTAIDTIVVYVAKLQENDTQFAATWRLRLRLENGGRFSPWSEFGPFRLISPGQMGVPRAPILKVIP